MSLEERRGEAVSRSTIFLFEYPGHLPAVVASSGLWLVNLVAVRFIPRIGVAITTVRPSVSIGMIPSRLHPAIVPPEI